MATFGFKNADTYSTYMDGKSTEQCITGFQNWFSFAYYQTTKRFTMGDYSGTTLA